VKRRQFTPHASIKPLPTVHLWENRNSLTGQNPHEVNFIYTIKGALRNARTLKQWGSYKPAKPLAHKVVLVFKEPLTSRWLMDSPLLSLVAWLTEHSRSTWEISPPFRAPIDYTEFPRRENPPQVTVGLADHTDFVALMLLGEQAFSYLETRP
jgi:hypothetical protein